MDLNRNFDVTDSNGESRWENVEGSSGAYKGANSFSENESQAIRDYINSYNDIHLVIETHARGNVNLEGDYRFFAVYPDDNSARDLESAIINAVNSSKKHFDSGGGQRGYTRDNTNPSCYSWIFYEKDILASPACVASQYATEGTQIKKLIDVITGSGFTGTRQVTPIIITCADNEMVRGTYVTSTGWSWSLI